MLPTKNTELVRYSLHRIYCIVSFLRKTLRFGLIFYVLGCQQNNHFGTRVASPSVTSNCRTNR